MLDGNEGWLVLTRRPMTHGDSDLIFYDDSGRQIGCVRLMEVREGNKVRVGCKFDQSIKIFRAELAQPERKPERPAFDLGGEAGGP